MSTIRINGREVSEETAALALEEYFKRNPEKIPVDDVWGRWEIYKRRGLMILKREECKYCFDVESNGWITMQNRMDEPKVVSARGNRDLEAPGDHVEFLREVGE